MRLAALAALFALVFAPACRAQADATAGPQRKR
jgi:hypothetical protein